MGESGTEWVDQYPCAGESRTKVFHNSTEVNRSWFLYDSCLSLSVYKRESVDT